MVLLGRDGSCVASNMPPHRRCWVYLDIAHASHHEGACCVVRGAVLPQLAPGADEQLCLQQMHVTCMSPWWCIAGAKAALPELLVEVQSTIASYRQGYNILSARLAAHALTRHWLVCKGTAAQQACSEHVIRVPVWQLLSVPEGGCPSHRQAVHSQALARCNQLSIQAGSFMMHVRVRRPPLQCCCCMC